jgi:hypothetical protein
MKLDMEKLFLLNLIPPLDYLMTLDFLWKIDTYFSTRFLKWWMCMQLKNHVVIKTNVKRQIIMKNTTCCQSWTNSRIWLWLWSINLSIPMNDCELMIWTPCTLHETLSLWLKEYIHLCNFTHFVKPCKMM